MVMEKYNKNKHIGKINNKIKSLCSNSCNHPLLNYSFLQLSNQNTEHFLEINDLLENANHETAEGQH